MQSTIIEKFNNFWFNQFTDFYFEYTKCYEYWFTRGENYICSWIKFVILKESAKGNWEFFITSCPIYILQTIDARNREGLGIQFKC